MIYTERVPKSGILTRRRHEFEPGLAGAEAAQLIKLGDAGGFKVIGRRRRQKPTFETRSVYPGHQEFPLAEKITALGLGS